MNRSSETLEKLREATPSVLPSLLLCDFGNLEREIERLEEAGVSCLHLDVMDGVFVPNFTYGITIVDAIRKLTDMPLDVHLMMVNADQYIPQFCKAGADVLTVHAEACDNLPATLDLIKQHDVLAGIALNPDTAVDSISSAVSLADLVLIMSVHAGFGGQSFMPSVLPKFDQIRNCPGGENVLLEIDGGINVDTVRQATDAGAELLVAGSAVFKQDDYQVALENLMKQVNMP